MLYALTALQNAAWLVALMNYQDGESIVKALSVFSAHIKQAFPRYDMATAHKEILLDFAEGEVNAFQESFGVEININKQCTTWLF